jgi:hypothetical protein
MVIIKSGVKERSVDVGFSFSHSPTEKQESDKSNFTPKFWPFRGKSKPLAEPPIYQTLS